MPRRSQILGQPVMHGHEIADFLVEISAAFRKQGKSGHCRAMFFSTKKQRR
jgi:hypothetical protein